MTGPLRVTDRKMTETQLDTQRNAAQTLNEALSQSDLQKVTGYKLAKKQREALTSMKIPYGVDRNGRPVLTWTVFNNSLLAGSKQSNETNGFNLEAI